MTSPRIIRAPFSDLVTRTRERAEFHLGKDKDEDKDKWSGDDLAMTLIQVFARMARHVVDRINLLPERTFADYVDFLGVAPNPPRAARVPLTFQLVERGDAEPVIPAGTRVGAMPVEGDTREIVFETTQALSTTRAKLVAVITATTTNYSIHTASVVDRGAAFEPFSALIDFCQQDPNYCYYITADWLNNNQASATYKATLDSGDPSELIELKLTDAPRLNVGGKNRRWIPLTNNDEFFLTVTATSPVAASLSNGHPVDMTKPFFPFGIRPAVHDTFHVALDEHLAIPGCTVTLKNISSLSPNGGPTICWEVETQDGWVTLGRIPEDRKISTIAGVRACWLRARITDGGYGIGVYSKKIVPVAPSTDPVYYKIVEDFTPPSLTHLSVTYGLLTNYYPGKSPEVLGVEVVEAGKLSDPTEGEEGDTLSVLPVLYLGFDRPFPNRRVALYVQVATPDATKALKAPPRVIWERWSAGGWVTLDVQDGTRGLATTGLVEFIGPPAVPRGLKLGLEPHWLGRKAHWLRIRALESVDGKLMPKIERILTNTVWATHTVTFSDETVGSSNGEAGQVFRLAHQPVLTGERIEVLESALAAGVDTVQDEPSQRWVAWSQAPDFHTSGPDDRHYVLNRATGELRFGDGAHGMVPPRGAGNIRASRYQTGGGADGNRAPDTLTVLKSSLAYVSGVTNLVSASGGAEWETAAQRQRRGPRTLRHRGRAVTVEDLEDLAFEASPSVARVKVIPGVISKGSASFGPNELADEKNRAGVTLKPTKILVVPSSTEMPPRAHMALLQDVADFLRARSSPRLEFQVAAPTWIAVKVEVDFAATSDADVEAVKGEIARKLRSLMDPFTGGDRGVGWDFGRIPSASDVLRALRTVVGVDHIKTAKITPNDPKVTEWIAYPGEIVATAS